MPYGLNQITEMKVSAIYKKIFPHDGEYHATYKTAVWLLLVIGNNGVCI